VATVDVVVTPEIHVLPSVVVSTTYDVTTEPPLLTGANHETVIDESEITVVTF
jgi:hypothetical protein